MEGVNMDVFSEKRERPENEYHVLNAAGEAVAKMVLPEDIGDEFYVDVLSDEEEKRLPYKKILRGIVDHERDIVRWSDGTEEKARFDEDVVFAVPSENRGEMQQIKGTNIKIAKVDRKNKTVSYE